MRVCLILIFFASATICNSQPKHAELANEPLLSESYAVLSAKEAGTIDSADAGRWHSEANASFRAGNWWEAIESYKKAAALSPHTFATLHNLGLSYLQINEYSLAANALARASTLVSNNADTWSFQGYALYKLKELIKAAKCYEQVITLRPNWAIGHSNLGYVYLDLERYADARAKFSEALKLDAMSKEANLGLCHTYIAKRYDDKAALTACQRAIEMDPTSPQANFLLGYAYVDLGDHAQAMLYFRRTLELQPNTARVHLALGFAEFNAAQYESALADFRRAAELKPQMAQAYFGSGIVRFQLKHLDEASRMFTQAVELDDEYPEARFGLGIVCLVQGNRDCALTEYNYLKIAHSPLADSLFQKLFQNRVLKVRSSAGADR